MGEVRQRAARSRKGNDPDAAQWLTTLLTYSRLTRPQQPLLRPSGWRNKLRALGTRGLLAKLRMVASLLQKPVAARHQQPQREQPVRSRHQPSNFEAGAAPPPRIAHAAARARAVKPAGEEMSVRKAVSNYKETRTNEVGAAKGAVRSGTRRKESTTKVARHGMWLQNTMNECGRKRNRTGDG